MISKILNIQGRTIKITIEDNGSYYAPQWIEASEDVVYFDKFTALLGFKNPLSAIKQIGREIIELSTGLDKPVYFIGSTDKRTRVYSKLLKSCGFTFSLINEPVDNELAINLNL